MKRDLLNLLLCPVCRERFHLTPREEHEGDVIEGTLSCSCPQPYPIHHGIPRLLPGDLGNESERMYVRTTKSFGWEWRRYEVQDVKTDQAVFHAKTGFVLAGLEGRLILDAGCGGGRYSYIAGIHGAEVVAVDLSLAVEKAREMNAHLGNVQVLQANLMSLPFQEESFDLIYSIGVLHHTPDTRAAFNALIPLLKKGGRIAIWVYPRWTPYRERMNRFWRDITTRLPYPLLHYLCLLAAPLGWLTLKAGKTPLIRNVMWAIEKSIPFSTHPDWRIRVCDTFDWYSPQFQWHHTEEEVEEWFKERGMKEIINLGRMQDAYSPLRGGGVNFVGTKA